MRKTAGTSLNAAFWSLGDISGTTRHWTREDGRGGLKFVRHDAALISKGDYFFGSSHIPAYLLEIPPETFTITILRDPVRRLKSYYRNLRFARTDPRAADLDLYSEAVEEESAFMDGGPRAVLASLSVRSLRTESGIKERGAAQYLRRLRKMLIPARTFQDFLAVVPPRRLYTQLYMFSPRYEPEEAAERICACDAVCFTETMSEDLQALGERLDLPLEEQHERRQSFPVEPSDEDEAILRERLEPEYRMLELVRRYAPRTAPPANT